MDPDQSPFIGPPPQDASPFVGPPDNQTQQQNASPFVGPPQTSAVGAAAAGAAPAVAPVTAAIGAGVRGAALGTALFPELAPWSTIGGGLTAGLVASGVVGKIQDWLRDKYGPSTGPLSKEYEAAAAAQHPLAYNVGRAAPIALGMTTGNVAPEVRAGSAALFGGVDVLQQGLTKGFGNIDPTEALVQAGAGAVLPQAREWAGGARPGMATEKPAVYQEGAVPSGGEPGTGAIVPKTNLGKGLDNTGAVEEPQDIAERQDQTSKTAPFNTSPAKGVAAPQPPVPGAEIQHEGEAGPDERYGATIGGEGSERNQLKPGVSAGIGPGNRVDGAQTTVVETPPADRPVSAEVATAISPTPLPQSAARSEPPAAGPVPGPVTVPAAAAPVQAPQPPVPTQPSAAPTFTGRFGRPVTAQPVIKTQAQQIAEDPTLQRLYGKPWLSAATSETPTPAAPVSQPPTAQGLIDTAIGQALNRPIVRQPMPSIANSSKDPNGPVVIDPRVPVAYEKPLATHETVEQTLMAQGMPYEQAHVIATQAERTVAEHMGIDWDQYSKTIADMSPGIEAQKINPAAWQQLDLHEDPYAAIGHHTDKDIMGELRQAVGEPELGQVNPAAPEQVPPAESIEKPSVPQAENTAIPEDLSIPPFLRRQPPAAQSAIQTSMQALRRSSMPNVLGRSYNAMLDKWDTMTGGGSGGKSPPPNFVSPNPNNPTSPNADPAAQGFANSLYRDWAVMKGRLRNTYKTMGDLFMRAPQVSDEDATTISRAYTRGTLDQLPANLKPAADYFSKVLAPKANEVYDETYKLNRRWNLLNIDKPHPGIQTKFLSRQEVNTEPVERGEDAITGQQMSIANPLLRKREFHTALQVDKDGNVLPGAQPILIKDQGNGKATQWQNKKPTNFKYETGEDEPDISNVGTFFTDDKNNRWIVDHADAGHIMDQGIINPLSGKPYEYNENPFTATYNSMEANLRASAVMKLLSDIKDNPKYAGNFENEQGPAKDRFGGLYQTNLKQFRGTAKNPIYMSQEAQQAFNDFAQPKIWSPKGLESAAQGLIQTMYVPGWPIHAMNVATDWFIGKPWGHTEAWAGLLHDFPTAYKDVMTRGPIQQQINDAGGDPQFFNVLNERDQEQIFRNAGQEMVRNNPFWKPFADKMGTTVPQLAQNVYNWSKYELWRTNAMLYTQQYMTFKRMGMQPNEAVDATERFINSYRLNNKVLGQRWLAQVYKTPAYSLFGGYHGGQWQKWQDVLTGLAGKNDKFAQKDAVASAIAMGVIAMFVYPYILNPIAQGITGNKDASFAPRGMLTIPAQAAKIASGEAGYESLTPNVFTPSLPVSGAIGALRNQDWTGQPLIPRNDLRSPGNAVRAGIQGVDAAGRMLIPPYSNLSSGLSEKGTNPLRVLRKQVTQNIGIRDPSQASINYLQNIGTQNKRLQAEHRAGPLERGYNKLTGQ